MSEPREPVTEAGRLALEDDATTVRTHDEVRAAILAIEAEAAAESGRLREALREKVEALRSNALLGYENAIARDLTGSRRPIEARLWDVRLAALNEVFVLLAAPPAPSDHGAELDVEHRIGPPHWEPGCAQDEWVNRCLRCTALWPCKTARLATPSVPPEEGT